MKKLSNVFVVFAFAVCFSSFAVAQDKTEKNSKSDSAKTVLKYAGEGSAFFLKGDYQRRSSRIKKLST